MMNDKFRENNKIITTKPRAYIDDLDTLDFALTTAPKVLKNFDRYPKRAFGYVFGSRGCPYACTFCDQEAIYYNKIAKFNYDRVIAEIDWVSDHKIDFLYFADSNVGIFDRDIDFIKYVAKCKNEKGFPKR